MSASFCVHSQAINDFIEEHFDNIRAPFSAGFELTAKCNLNCLHCYAKSDRNHQDFTTEEFKHVFDELINRGMLEAYFTGGEIFTRPDFDELYVYAKRKGVILILLTNITLLTQHHIDLFKEYPVESISTTMYGCSEETYERVTGVKGSYKLFMDASQRIYALPWYEKAADGGSSQALHELTYFYEGHYIGIDADPEKAKRAQDKTLAMNNPDAIFKLASQYYAGDRVEENKEKAFQYYLRAAKLGNEQAVAQVGLCYLNGEGVKKNDAKAFTWFSRSEDDLYGYYNLAQCYLKGIGTEKDIEKAIFYLEKADECKCVNLSEARKQLVELYSKGPYILCNLCTT